MDPSEVRARVLADHERLRQGLAEVEHLAEEVIGSGQGLIGNLRQAAIDLLESLAAHMSWEDLYLAPALKDADAWGPERLARLEAEHRQQREELQELLAALEEQHRPATVLASRVLEWANTLHADMEEEEASFLDPKVLRDDVVAIDVETG